MFGKSKPVPGVLASFAHIDSAVDAIKGLRARGHTDLTVYSADWPLLVGGKPIASVPPYVVIMFELTVLFGALSTVTGVALLALRKPTTGIAYDPRYTNDLIGIFVPCAADRAGDVETLLKQSGPVEVRRAA
jgi:hypothetical protein